MKRNLAGRLLDGIKRHGFRLCIIIGISRILGIKSEVQRVKDRVTALLEAIHGRRVAYGPFEGMLLGEQPWWAPNDKIPQLLGVYEEHVARRLLDLSARNVDHFIDVGAADGYFCVGLAKSRCFERVTAFEISMQGQAAIRSNAIVNGCEARIDVRGVASAESLSAVLCENEAAVILVDIEGGEYALLDSRLLRALAHCHIIIELHPWTQPDGVQSTADLAERARDFFRVTIFGRDRYCPDDFDELAHLPDEERLIVLGEGRPERMNWMYLEPRESSATGGGDAAVTA